MKERVMEENCKEPVDERDEGDAGGCCCCCYYCRVEAGGKESDITKKEMAEN